MMDFELLKKLCAIHAPTGNEGAMTDFLLSYINEEKGKWKTRPVMYHGGDFQECIILAFGVPRTAIYAHIDSIGFTVRYNNQLVRIGSPKLESGFVLINGKDQVDYRLLADSNQELFVEAQAELPRGMDLTFKPDWREDEEYIQCCYMDNRLGVFTALSVCETLTGGIVVFSCREEHGGGSIPYISRFLHERYGVLQSLICDITWVTEGVRPGKGVVVSMRDSGIPRRKYIDRIIALARESGLPFQLEVEQSGGSDGIELQRQPYPVQWCFIGAPEENVHSPDEKVHKKDAVSMSDMYRFLMERL